ncbi:conserved hypothetical protein [Beijerinckia indica subsp. indica ATCC 9039]|uniref:VWA-like domain-containing protein n=2 Tax=Beijerinckia TaxID=532 RepID=B2IHS8_BEII9|nr:conserved hypothetical protein [Beijerinckia indica subsp. indica ATCC 9039]
MPGEETIILADGEREISSLPLVVLSEPQQKAWGETRAAFLWRCPAFSHVLYALMTTIDNELAYFTEHVDIAGTDGFSLFLNPEPFFALPLSQREYLMAHLIAHCILDHMHLATLLRRSGQLLYADGLVLPLDETRLGLAQDLIVNDMLVSAQIGTLPEVAIGRHEPRLGKATESSIGVYRKLHQDAEPGRDGSLDNHLEAGSATPKSWRNRKAVGADGEKNHAAWAAAIAEAAEIERLQGRHAGVLSRFLGQLLIPKIHWRDKIAAFFARETGRSRYSWRKLDRHMIVRGIGAPARIGEGANLIIIGVDSSGSVTEASLRLFLTEISGILDALAPRRLLVIWCDAVIQRMDELEAAEQLLAIRSLGAPGGGGTSFVPVFDYIAEQDLVPDALIYLTDGEGLFPDEAPDYPVLWGSVADHEAYPFGEVVRLCP